MKMGSSIKTIDGFIAQYPSEVQKVLQELRRVIKEVAPEAGEKIAYGIPTFTLHGNLVHFSAYDKHIGFYPGWAPIAAFKEELEAYETAKGTVRFPIDKPLPFDLIRKMTQFAVERNMERKK